MKTYIGIDLGTSSAKFLLCDECGKILRSANSPYPVFSPREGWFEQNPEDWFAAVLKGVTELLQGFDKREVEGIGIGGQMHGLVALDGTDEVIRPCILWNDGRTKKQTDYLNEVIGKDLLSRLTANVAFAGFTAPKLMWLKENERENFNKIRKIMLPKDYVVYRLTGVHATDFSDASGTLLLDVKNRRWSKDMCRLTGVDEGVLPRLFESFAPVGELKEEFKKLWGIKHAVVCAGAGDNAAAAVGTGAVFDGDCNISLGTSGTVFISKDEFSEDGQNALHSFCHANGGYHLMGCILSAASAYGWWQKILGNDKFGDEMLSGTESSGGVYFLPYLAGERSPHNDVDARGAFWGLSMSTTREETCLAVMEGVAFALKDCLEAAKRGGALVSKTKICGGGAKSLIWRRIIADVLGVEVNVPAVEEGPAYGAAILAMTACGEYPSVFEACKKITAVKERLLPNPARVEQYRAKYETYKKLYPALKTLYS